MVTIFLVCAVLGSGIVVIQFILSLMGLGHDVDGDFSGDVHADFDHGGLDQPVDGDHAGQAGGHFFGILSFRAMVAALAVFGLAGLAADRAGFGAAPTLVIAVGVGAAALVGVAWAMRLLYGLKDDGTVHIERAVGHHGTVYLTIPAERAGSGKVFLNLQNRTVECQAVTAKDKLPSGSQVVVVGIVGPNTVEVEPLPETGREKLSHA